MTTFPLPRVLAPIDPPGIFTDERGTFVESWRAGEDIPPMVCGLRSWSKRGALRGLHFQRNNPRALIIRCVDGQIWDMVVDLRKGSPHYKRVATTWLKDPGKGALFVPAGFAHGFYALTDAVVVYDCSEVFDPESSETLLWNDAALWSGWCPMDSHPIVSAKDQAGKRLDEIEPLEI